VYVGANDGMMHAFRATDGKELFAYIPRAVSQNLNKLTNPAYVHQPYVDGVPAVGEAQIGTTWKTVLAAGMGGGAQGVFALDVTSPAAFSASNVLFEFTDQDDADMGNVLSQPKIVKMRMAGSTTPEFKWFLAVGSGYNNYKNDGNYTLTGRQALFLLSLDKAPNTPWTLNTNYYKVVVNDPVTTTAAGMSNPGFVTGAGGEATAFYAGDLQGNLWKFGFSGGLSSTNAASSIKVVSGSPAPMYIARDNASNRQPITISPVVTSALGRGYMVVFGTGKFVEPSDSDTTGTQSIYGVWDNQTTDNTDFQIGRSKLYQRTMVQGTSTITLTGSETFTFGTGSTGNYRGWYVDLPNARERIATEGTGGLGAVAFNSTIPDGTCSGDGGATSMCFNTIYGNAACEFTKSTAGLLSRPNFVTIDDASEAYSLRTATGRRLASLKGSVISTGTKITDAGNIATSTAKVTIPPIPGGRLGWREIRNFKEN
jgi:type IV pilus assembly protein PilY1